MRFYKTKSISDILKGFKEEGGGLLSSLAQQRELYEIWDQLEDYRLKKIEVTFMIQKGESIRIICPSPMTFNYIRQRRQLIEHCFNPYLSKQALNRIEITLK